MSTSKSAQKTLADKIAKGEYAPGQRLPSERAIATELGVSRSTVQSILRTLELKGLLHRQPNCRPVVSQTVAPPVQGDQIAVWILPETQDLGGMLILQGIRNVLGASNYSLLMGCPPSRRPDDFASAELEFLRAAMVSPNVAGAIVWDIYNQECNKAYAELVQRGKSLVFIDRAPDHALPADIVGTDNYQAAITAVRHLIEQGHHRIAMVLTDRLASTVRERAQGYRQALDDAEIPVDQSLLVDCPDDLTIPLTKKCEGVLKGLLAKANPPTAIFAVNDCIALHLLEAARNIGVGIPGEVSLVGFDWLLRTLPNGGDLTTIAQPFEEIGETAAERLLDRIRSNKTQSRRKILFDAPLVLRKSTQRPSSALHDLSATIGASVSEAVTRSGA